jgi:hypothetical protein
VSALAETTRCSASARVARSVRGATLRDTGSKDLSTGNVVAFSELVPSGTPGADTRFVTLMRLGIGFSSRTLCSTDPCKWMIELVRYTQRNVKHWRDGDMHKRRPPPACSSPSSSSAGSSATGTSPSA